jgi:RND family efflux transporter MFP subunit
MLTLNLCQIRLVLLAAALCGGVSAFAQPGGMGPSLVAVAPGREGILAEQSMRSGVVMFKEISEVASEVAGKIVEVNFEEGDRVEQGAVLVRLDDAVLTKELQSKQAAAARYAAELADAETRYTRAESLIEDEVTTPQQLDQLRFEVESDRQQAASMRAEVERMRTLIEKNTIRAPFDGVVVDRSTELGEWKAVGETVAILAREDLYDVIVSVPETELRWLNEGSEVAVELRAAGKSLTGVITTVIPMADVASNTFPVKVRVEHEEPLYEGMNAEVYLPIAEPAECLFVPRDALLRVQGRSIVFTVDAGKAVQHDVRLLGYDGRDDQWAAIDAPGLSASQRYIVKGHERLRGGDAVRVQENEDSKAKAGPLSADG